jgi:hypothetical protein
MRRIGIAWLAITFKLVERCAARDHIEATLKARNVGGIIVLVTRIE